MMSSLMEHAEAVAVVEDVWTSLRSCSAVEVTGGKC